jgi:hypothetical protein
MSHDAHNRTRLIFAAPLASSHPPGKYSRSSLLVQFQRFRAHNCNGTKRPTLCTVPYTRYLYRHRKVFELLSLHIRTSWTSRAGAWRYSLAYKPYSGIVVAIFSRAALRLKRSRFYHSLYQMGTEKMKNMTVKQMSRKMAKSLEVKVGKTRHALYASAAHREHRE